MCDGGGRRGWTCTRGQLTFDYIDLGTGESWRGRISPADRVSLRGWLRRFDGVRDVDFAVEGCTGWRYVVEELHRAKITVHLAEPAETADRRGSKQRAKNDPLIPATFASASQTADHNRRSSDGTGSHYDSRPGACRCAGRGATAAIARHPGTVAALGVWLACQWIVCRIAGAKAALGVRTPPPARQIS